MPKVIAAISIDEEGNYLLTGSSLSTKESMIQESKIPGVEVFILEIDIRPITVKTVNDIPSKIGCTISKADKTGE